MKTTIDYSKSACPNFDAVQDVMEYLGERYDVIAREMAEVTDGRHFQAYCGLIGIRGKPVQAWYDHFHGEGAWDKLPDW